jgi:AraC-like DNA-binding protein
MYLPDKFFADRSLQNLVENQTSYTLENASMHVFETHQQAERVFLRFDEVVLASMVKGKKIMHLRDTQSFDFFPGESLILPANEIMCIDFPEATAQMPTQCLAMTISESKINEIVILMNESNPKLDGQVWQFTNCNFHFCNELAVTQIINRLLMLFIENHPSKALFVDFMLKELLIRILQTESRKVHTENTKLISNNNRLAFVIQYIRDHINDQLSVELLSQKAHMSESHFFKVFKNELGISPVDFINNERIRIATSLLHEPDIKMTEISMSCGFNSLSYFNRVFKKAKAVSPSEYRAKVLGD